MPRAKTLLLSFLLTYCTLVWAKDIELQEAWISEAPPTVSVLAGYLRIINNMDKAVELSGVSSPIFESIEIHKSRVVDGVASMQKQTSLFIPAMSSVELKPGGLHLMLFEPGQPLKAGDRIKLQLQFADGSVSSIEAEIRAPAHQHHHHHH